MHKVLLTGASGRIGQTFYIASQKRYNFVLTDVRKPSYPVQQPHQFVQADLTKTRKVLGYNPEDDAFATFPIPLK